MEFISIRRGTITRLEPPTATTTVTAAVRPQSATEAIAALLSAAATATAVPPPPQQQQPQQLIATATTTTNNVPPVGVLPVAPHVIIQQQIPLEIIIGPDGQPIQQQQQQTAQQQQPAIRHTCTSGGLRPGAGKSLNASVLRRDDATGLVEIQRRQVDGQEPAPPIAIRIRGEMRTSITGPHPHLKILG